MSRKVKMAVALLSVLAIGIGAYAAFKCNVCNGTGWNGQFKCWACKGTGQL